VNPSQASLHKRPEEAVLTRSIVITGASKGNGRAAAKGLAATGWEVIGIARHTPTNFPGQFVTTDLSDPEGTAELASILAGRGNVLGIVKNVGIAKHELFEYVNLSTSRILWT
jgi:3-oxoacyl-[acyl-carrier protein] reductase